MSPLEKAADDVIQATNMEIWKDLTSRLVVSFLAKEPDLADGVATEVEAYHWYMTRFFNTLKSIQESKEKSRQ